MTGRDFSRVSLGTNHVKAPEQDTSGESNETAVWRDFKDGDEAAFVWIYKTYFETLYNYGHQFGFETEVIRDQIQELFIYLRNHRKQLGQVNNIKYYLYKSLRRRLIAASKKRFSFFPLAGLEHSNQFEIAFVKSTEVKLIESLISEETSQYLANSMKKLTPRQREAVLHFYYEGMSYKQTADIMNFKEVKSVRKLIYRAIDALRKDLKGLKKR